MTYNVFGGTLNLNQSVNYNLFKCVFVNSRLSACWSVTLLIGSTLFRLHTSCMLTVR